VFLGELAFSLRFLDESEKAGVGYDAAAVTLASSTPGMAADLALSDRETRP
jgi:hypothetical protein